MDQPQSNLDRRPIAVRTWPVFGALSRLLVRLGVSANAVSIVGMIAGVGAGAALAATTSRPDLATPLLLLAAALIQLRLLCNMIDGLVALEGKRQTPTGELFNEVPDRISDVATLVGAGFGLGSSPTLGWLSAMMALFVAYVRAVGKGAGLPSDFRGPMAKQQRMATVTIACLYLGLAPASWQPRLPAWRDAPAPGVLALALAVVTLGSVFTAARRLWAIASGLRDRGRTGV